MKKILAMLLALIVCLSICGCGESEATYENTDFTTFESVLGIEGMEEDTYMNKFMYDGNEYEVEIYRTSVPNGCVYEYNFKSDALNDSGADPLGYSATLQNYEQVDITDEQMEWGKSTKNYVGYFVHAIYGYEDKDGNVLFMTGRWSPGEYQYTIAIYYN